MEVTWRQQEIIDVALELIASGGIQALTIKNLARNIGFAESAIYRHYNNKTQILLAILDFFEHNTDQFFLNQLDTNVDALTKIELLFQNHFRKFSVTPSLVSVIFSEEIFRNEEELTIKVKGIMSKNIGSIRLILETGQRGGEIRTDIPASDLSLIIVGSLRMLVKHWQMSNYEFNLVERGATFINTIKTLVTSNL